MELRVLPRLRGFGFRLEGEVTPERVGQNWGRLLLAAGRAGRRWAAPRVGLRHGAGGETTLYEGFLPLEGGEALESFESLAFEGGLYALTLARGPYHRLSEAFERILREEGLPAGSRPAGGPRLERYLDDPREVPEGELRVELGVPVERA